MENYADVLDAIVRDKEAAIKKEQDHKDAVEKAERARKRKILEPLITVLTQLKPKIEAEAYVFLDNYGDPECKVSSRNLYAKFNGSIIAGVSRNKNTVYVAERDRGGSGRGTYLEFETATEAIPVFLEAISNMLIHG